MAKATTQHLIKLAISKRMSEDDAPKTVGNSEIRDLLIKYFDKNITPSAVSQSTSLMVKSGKLKMSVVAGKNAFRLPGAEISTEVNEPAVYESEVPEVTENDNWGAVLEFLQEIKTEITETQASLFRMDKQQKTFNTALTNTLETLMAYIKQQAVAITNQGNTLIAIRNDDLKNMPKNSNMVDMLNRVQALETAIGSMIELFSNNTHVIVDSYKDGMRDGIKLSNDISEERNEKSANELVRIIKQSNEGFRGKP